MKILQIACLAFMVSSYAVSEVKVNWQPDEETVQPPEAEQPDTTEVEADGQPAMSDDEIEQIQIENFAKNHGEQYRVEPCLLLSIAAQESNLNPQIEDGDEGLSKGMFQFWDPHLDWLRTKGIVGDPYDPEQAFRMAAQYLSFLDTQTPKEDFDYAAEIGRVFVDQRNGEQRALSRIATLGAMYNGGPRMFANRRPIRKPAAIAYGRDIEKRVLFCKRNDARWRLKKVGLVTP